MRALTEILTEQAVGTIHFMVIDVEGAEGEVIAGLDLRRFRPWVLIVESTAPLSNEATQGSWESRVLESGYRFAAFDGVNRFYVAEEHAGLVGRLFDAGQRPGRVPHPSRVGAGRRTGAHARRVRRCCV